MPVAEDYTFTWVDNSVVWLALFQRKKGWSWLGYMDPWVTVLKELVLTSDPKPQFPENQRTGQKDP